MMESSAFVYTRGAGHDIEYCIELCPALTVSGQIATLIMMDIAEDERYDNLLCRSRGREVTSEYN